MEQQIDKSQKVFDSGQIKSILLSSLAGSQLSYFMIPRSQRIMQIYFRWVFVGIVQVGTIQSYRIDFSVMKQMQQIILFAQKKIYWNTNSTPNLKKLEAQTRHLNQNYMQGPNQFIRTSLV
ncbi:Hypothetical_protein [Hexamita inflata]|uniref:Hypothetical_protein n=1 Tax=Hexamita inflata TaxID=28002 RepID=A0AA86N729_9EUKA|nr:Hypothetical protein HINF_LOCUS1566 [Hexamita inflata]